jgi:retron-type reverse transcriptase
MEFEDFSYGFRPNRNAQQAVQRSLSYINEGKSWIVDMDLQNFFDEVDHSLLLEILYRKIKCRPTLRLIRKWLRAPMCINGKLVKRRKGMPQGGLCTVTHKPPYAQCLFMHSVCYVLLRINHVPIKHCA